MSINDFEKLLAAALPARGRLAITLTEFPSDDELFELLDRAVIAGECCGAPLAEIHAPRDRFAFDGAWRHAAVKDGGDVLRLVFESEEDGPPPELARTPNKAFGVRSSL